MVEMVEIMKSDRNERYEAPQPPNTGGGGGGGGNNSSSNAMAAANANAAAAAAAAMHQQHHLHHHHMHQQQQHPGGAPNGMVTQMQHTRYYIFAPMQEVALSFVEVKRKSWKRIEASK